MTASAPFARSHARSFAAFALITLIWGSTWLVIKDQIGTVPPGWSVTWRFALAAAGMFALALARGERIRLPRDVLRLTVVIGLTQFFANFQLVYRAELHITSGLVAVLFALLLVPNALFGRIFLGARVSPRFFAGSLVALIGIALLLLHEYRVVPVGGAVLLGVGMTLCALLSASAANILQATSLARDSSIIVLIAWAMLWGALADAAFAWLTSGPPQFDTSAHYVLGVGYLALIGSVLTFPLYFTLIRDWGPGKAAYNGVAVPVVAMTLSTLFEGYRWTALAGAGAALAMIGLLVALSGRK